MPKEGSRPGLDKPLYHNAIASVAMVYGKRCVFRQREPGLAEEGQYATILNLA